ncbi:MAG: DUF2087 domain-containing protein [Actinomycetes bacterium]
MNPRTTDDALIPSRHLDADGRMIAMPRKRANRRVVLEHCASLIEPGVDHSETEVNNRLRPVDDDVALLRRYLVDEGLIVRRPPGIYRRAEGPAASAD